MTFICINTLYMHLLEHNISTTMWLWLHNPDFYYRSHERCSLMMCYLRSVCLLIPGHSCDFWLLLPWKDSLVGRMWVTWQLTVNNWAPSCEEISFIYTAWGHMHYCSQFRNGYYRFFVYAVISVISIFIPFYSHVCYYTECLLNFFNSLKFYTQAFIERRVPFQVMTH